MGKDPWEALVKDFADLTNLGHLTHILVRLLVAAALGGLLGYQRERVGKAAGLRTHMLVALGAACFILVPQLAGMTLGDLSRVIQGIVTGIGFLGGGAILKLTDEKKIKGLTTAAGIWMTAAVGIAAGMGRVGAALLATALAFVIMEFLYRLDQRIGQAGHEDDA